MATVEYVHVDKEYPNGSRAIEDFNLLVEDGEMMVLVGPSGCGKSTALRLLAGLDPVSHGELRIDGIRVNESSPQLRNIAMVFQNYALYPHMTVRRNLEFPLRMMKLPKAERVRRIEETAGMLGISELLERRPRQLSGGQRQRVAMGRALVRHPRVFLMDEPLSNLDMKLRTRIRSEIASLQKRLGVTTIYVTHDQVEAMTLGDRIAVLKEGKLQQCGRPQELYDQPANTFVATFLGNPGMNIFRAWSDKVTATLKLAGGGWQIPLEPLLRRKPILAQYVEHPLLAGLRPEAFSPRPTPVAKVLIESVESLGHERLVHFVPLGETPAAERETLVARLPGPQVEKVGQSIELGFDSGQLHLFTIDGKTIG
ncbi:MAG: ABC transporter ATP-binding protein [Chromatiaceae bacterium]|nr:ABC transporter ATP-binding protein [Chromatiaceae bacterium]MCP5409802.1 ABC transporter ATP-binding protein [Chromatiaceae bacterium]MCP5442697.1 ABC transporter ATP-binding protein [Chromatiaceae bacterium]